MNKIGKVNLAAVGKELVAEEPQAADIGVDLYAALDGEESFLAARESQLAGNQKLGLLQGLLAVDDWWVLW